MKSTSVIQFVFLLLPTVVFCYSNSTTCVADNGNNKNVATTPSYNLNANTKIPGAFPSDSKSLYTFDLDWMLPGSGTLLNRLNGAFRFLFGGGLGDFIRSTYTFYGRKKSATIYDARKLEKESGLTKSEFFDKYGFVVVDHKSAMTAQGWEESDRDVNEIFSTINNETRYQEVMDDFRNGNTPVKQIYAKEVQELIKTVVVPRATDIMPPARGIRRYISMNLNKAPAKQIHNDYGLDFDDIVENNPAFDFKKQRQKFEETNSNEYMLINLWRPIKPMTEPLRSFPLCFLDSTTLNPNDFVTIDSKSLGVLTGLKDNPKHKFYYYPDMTIDEVLVFKQFHTVRNEGTKMPVFHTAFNDPRADDATEGRVSFEYRVGLLA